jgi:hypothetical protein
MCPFCIATTASIALAAVSLGTTPRLAAFTHRAHPPKKIISVESPNSLREETTQKERSNNA